jgi:hypothetical protein
MTFCISNRIYKWRKTRKQNASHHSVQNLLPSRLLSKCVKINMCKELFCSVCVWRSRDSAVDIATGYGLDDRGVGVRVPVGSRIFFSPRRPDRLCGPSSLVSKWVIQSPGVKRPGRKADHSPSTTAEVQVGGAIPPHPIRLDGFVLQ